MNASCPACAAGGVETDIEISSSMTCPKCGVEWQPVEVRLRRIRKQSATAQEVTQ